ncbi:monocyte to macrophage differentiation factor 2 isoform X1 [Schistocerca gregaria]|uniref:monocyte to macrophage differentiation factor 2 isoform X1 n=2 Tax=Schistocerca gregaria TaxID=7010 RepID=UPI00211E6C15|nr:monocyte to macrophage differentiation factor 2 isoform X1 [Schistocerca gregaria]XP_049854596.1 monocyte to macrophage differentiation factor 2 isoform X1 [Schistocerca gregaria]
MAPYKLQHIWMAVNNVFNFSWVQNVHWMNEKPTHHKPYRPAPIEHIANVVTHGVWVVPSIIACFALIQRATSWPQYWSAVIYGSALVLLFSVSTFFHSVFYCSHNRHLKDMLHRSDRAMIYVFIAASYFPWLMLTPLPPGGLAAELHWIVWVLASLGILYQQVFHEQYKCLETFFYLVMGITPSFAIINKKEDFMGLTELKIGGFVYIFGVIFFKADGKIPCAHAIWHMFVVMAAGIHYYAILNYLYPTNEIYT